MTTFYQLPELGTETALHTHLVVREDAQRLFGFALRQQRDLFRNLLKVSGVGPRVALAILSSITTDEFLSCMAEEDVDRLTRVPGIGRKTAQRLLVEMRDKLLKETPIDASTRDQYTPDPVHDAVSALIALGYKPAEASRAVRGGECSDGSSEELIRQALRTLGGSNL